jgi:hypothetical protein
MPLFWPETGIKSVRHDWLNEDGTRHDRPPPLLELGSGAPMLFVAGLSSEAGVEAARTERMNAS